MINKLSTQPFFLPILLLLGLTFHPAARTFTVDAGGPTLQAVQANACRKALGKAIDLYLPASVRREKAGKLNEVFFSKYPDYIQGQRVLSERRAFGLITQRIAVDIDVGKVRDLLAAENLIDARARRPVIALDVSVEQGDSGQAAVASASLAGALLAEGFRIAPLRGVFAKKNDSMAAADAFVYGADLLVRARVKIGESKTENIYGEPLPYVPIELHGRILQAGSGEPVAARTHSVYRGNFYALSATEFGLRTGGVELCSLLIVDLEGFWRSDGFNHQRLRMEFLDCGLDSVESLQKRLVTIKTIRAVRMVQADMRGVLFEADCAGGGRDIAAEVTRDSVYRSIRLAPDLLSFAPLHAASGPHDEGPTPVCAATRFSIDTLFPSRAGDYSRDSIAHLVFYGTDSVSSVRVEARLPDFMTLPATFELAGQVHDGIINLPMALDASKLLAQEHAGTFYAECCIDMNNLCKRAITVPVRVQGRNDFDWAYPEAIGGFLTPGDPALLKIASLIRHAVDDDRIDYNVQSAAAIAGYLRSMNIAYVPDPVSTGFYSIDRVQYPRETLVRRSGDCDDLAVLYAALCMVMGVPATFIVYADHVLVMINTGVSCRNAFAVSAERNLAVAYNGTLWLPVETTALKEGFVAAWKKAASDYRSAIDDKRDVTVLSLDTALRRLDPILPPCPLPALDTTDYRETIDRELAGLDADNRITTVKRIKQLRKYAGVDCAARNERALFEAYRGNYRKSVRLFRSVYRTTHSTGAGSNYACACALAGKHAEAQRLLDSLCSERSDGPLMLNRALSLLTMTNDSIVRSAFNERLDAALRAFSSPDSVFDILQITTVPSVKSVDASRGKTATSVNRQRLRELVIQQIEARQKTANSSHAAKPATVTLPAGVRGADPDDSEKLITLFYWYDMP